MGQKVNPHGLRGNGFWKWTFPEEQKGDLNGTES